MHVSNTYKQTHTHALMHTHTFISLTLAHVILQIGVAFSYVLWAVSHSFTVFVIARIFGGLCKGNVSLSTAIITDVTTPEKRSKGMVKYFMYAYLCTLSSL